MCIIEFHTAVCQWVRVVCYVTLYCWG